MDYLPRVTIEPAYLPLEVPYLCDDSDQLKPVWQDDTQGGQMSEGRLKSTVDVSQRDIAVSLQRELYFGLLEHLLCEGPGLAKSACMVVPGPGRSTLSAAALPSVLEIWRAKRQTGQKPSPPTDLESRLHIATAQLRRILSALGQELEYSRTDSISEPLPVIALSIQALIETLWDAHLPALAGSCDQPTAQTNPFWIENSFVYQLLRESGWLPSEIFSMPRDIRFRYYLSFFTQRQLQSLRRASINQTKKRPCDKECYRATHAEADCQCSSWLSSDLSDAHDLEDSFYLVSSSIDSEDPLLRTHLLPLSGSAKRKRFVAFSHVRSDGLGSSMSNSLPSCQIGLLQNLSNQLLPDEKTPVPFYIDTLCVPLKGLAKRNALRNIPELFRLADKVLVLDSDLQITPAGLPQENLTRIRYSVWAKRLWTIQECAVSQEVAFRFRNQNVLLNTLLRSYDDGIEFPLLRTQSLKDRNLERFTSEDYGRLSTALALLSDDMQLAESLQHERNPGKEAEHARASREGYDKWRLRIILRLGLLALPQMRYFSEANESAEFQSVTTGILDEYPTLDLSRQHRWHIAQQDPTALYARLKKIQSLQLILDQQAMSVF